MKPPMPTPETVFRVYRTLVEQNDQAIPMLLYCNGREMTAVPVMGEDGLTALVNALNVAVRKLGKPTWLVYQNEGYVKDVTGDPEQHRYGDAQKAVKEHAPGATEAVVMTAVSMTEAWFFEKPFVRTQHRVRWGKGRVHRHYGITAEGSGFGGPVADVLMQAVR